MTLTIDCLYLAERIDKSFDKFYVELRGVDRTEFESWTTPSLPKVIKTDPADIFQAELEILSAEIKDDAVVVSCNQHNSDLGYSGGNLIISCQSVKVFDQRKNEMTIEQLQAISKAYWEEWSKK